MTFTFYPGSREHLILSGNPTSKELFLYSNTPSTEAKDALETTQSSAVLSGQHRYGAIVG